MNLEERIRDIIDYICDRVGSPSGLEEIGLKRKLYKMYNAGYDAGWDEAVKGPKGK